MGSVKEPAKDKAPDIHTLITPVRLTKAEQLTTKIENDLEHQNLLIVWIEKGTYDLRRYIAIPTATVNEHTRSLTLWDSVEEKILVLNGGRDTLIKQGEDGAYTIISAPIDCNKMYAETHSRSSKHGFIDQNGVLVEYEDITPLGAFLPYQLISKAVTTNEVHKLFTDSDIPIIIPRFTVALKCASESSNGEFAAGVYEIAAPKGMGLIPQEILQGEGRSAQLTSNKASLLDYYTLATSNIEQQLTVAPSRFYAFGLLGKKGIHHPQLTLSNGWIMQWPDTAGGFVIAPVVTDFEDVTIHQEKMSNSAFVMSNILGRNNLYDIKLTPEVNGTYHMVTLALQEELLLWGRNFYQPASVEKLANFVDTVMGAFHSAYSSGNSYRRIEIDKAGIVLSGGYVITLRQALEAFCLSIKQDGEVLDKSGAIQNIRNWARIIAAIAVKETMRQAKSVRIQSDYFTRSQMQTLSTVYNSPISHKPTVPPPINKKQGRKRHKSRK